jgi:hypothetical protein
MAKADRSFSGGVSRPTATSGVTLALASPAPAVNMCSNAARSIR